MNLLVVLNTLLEEKNITRTGRRIYLSQSATSGALARLREFFNDELLVQIGHKMVLTPLAESLELPVRDVLIHAQAIIDQKPHFDAATSNRVFRVMMSDYVTATLMTKAIARLQVLAPSVQIDILPLADTPEEQLERGEVDILIMPGQFLSAAHPSRELFRDTYVCLAWEGNRSVGEEISETEYFAMNHIGVRYGMQISDVLEEWLVSKFGQTRHVSVTTHAYALIPQMLIGTNRIATVHSLLGDMYAGMLPVKVVRPQMEMPMLMEKLQWHRFRDKDPGIAWLRRFLRASGKEIVPPQQVVSAEVESLALQD